MTELEQAIDAIEHGLLTVTGGSERPVEKMELSQRLKHYKVPGVSAAFVYQEELAWAKGFGVMEAGCEKPVLRKPSFRLTRSAKLSRRRMA